MNIKNQLFSFKSNSFRRIRLFSNPRSRASLQPYGVASPQIIQANYNRYRKHNGFARKPNEQNQKQNGEHQNRIQTIQPQINLRNCQLKAPKHKGGFQPKCY